MALKLHDMIGLSADYIERADLRISGGMFRKMLRDSEGVIVGRLDTRYSAPPIDPMAKESDYDPQSAAISSAYVSAYNDYGRSVLGFGKDDEFKATAEVYRLWDTKHQPPGSQMALSKTTNVIPDLAATMRVNPKLKVMLCSGYFDLSTLFFAGEYELNHLNLPADLRKNIEIHHFMTGHMVYVNEDGLKSLHQAFSQFVASNSASR
jgi:carboxypeptidase C (cathepsin A)